MNFSWLDDFLALAATRNFSRAAQQRNMTQPAFSRRVRALEEWLDVELFDRSAQPVALTPAGKWFVEVARGLVERVGRLPAEAVAVAGAQDETLKFVATHALSLTFLPGWLRGLEARAPLGRIELVSDVAQRCERAMLAGDTQFMLCHTHAAVAGLLPEEDFIHVAVGADELVPVTSTAHAADLRFALDARGQAALPLLDYGAGSGLGRIVRTLHEAALAERGVVRVMTAHLATVLKSMALEGRGVAFLPLSLIDDALATQRLAVVGDARWRIPLGVSVYRPRAALPGAAETFWRALSQAA